MSITPESVQALLQSEDYGDRISGLNQLRPLDPAVAFTLIQPLTNDPHARVRYAAVSQLANLGTQDPGQALEILRDRLKHDSEYDVRAAAADAIGALKLTEAFDDLKEAYEQSDEWLLQFSIIAMLGEFGDPRSFEMLQDALSHPNELIQTAAITALGELGNAAAIPALQSFISHPDWQIRFRVAQALGRFNSPETKEALRLLAGDSTAQVAETAQMALKAL